MRLVRCLLFGFLIVNVNCIPVGLLYDYNVREAIALPKKDDVSSQEIKLRTPIVFYDVPYDSIYVNSNGFLSFQTEIPQFINIEFPLDYPIIAPFYSNVDTRAAGSISYYETNDPSLLRRATENIHESFLNSSNFQATGLFIATWQGVGYYNQGSDKVNTYQVVIASDGAETFVEFLYPENGIQWIQGTGDDSGLPDARAQAGFLSHDGKMLPLPGSGTEQVRNLERWSNMGLAGQFIFKVDGSELSKPDLHNEGSLSSGPAISCSDAPTACHVQAKCVDYDEGFCCKCNQNYYGNGKFCVKKDVPLRVNGKINGKINGERLENLDLQSYIAMSDARAYTAISKIPESIGFDIQSMQILGSVIGYLFAKPIREAVNGYQLTGGVFNHTATVTFLNTSQRVKVKQKYLGLDVFDQLRLESEIQGEIPTLPVDSKVNIDEYQEEFTLTSPGLIQSSSQHVFSYTDIAGNEQFHHYTVDQSIIFDFCKFENNSFRETWKLKVGRNFISYEAREQIIRFGLSNKITPFEDFDPCEVGRSKCVENSACVVDNDSYKCVCNPGFQQYYTGTEELCRDLNECQTGDHECDYNAQCINIIGSYTCECNPGFEGNGRICENARSCSKIRCNENAECVQGNEVAQCRCMAGFTGDGQICSPILDHSCHVANNCSPYGMCTIDRQTNNYYCACLPGYGGDGYRCSPIQNIPTESVPTTTSDFLTTTETNLSPRVPQNCNIFGLACTCPSGYEKVEGTSYCTPIQEQETTTVTSSSDSCQLLPSICHKDAMCQFSQALESYVCVCNEGFEGDGYSCEIEEVSCTKVDNCSPHATCTYHENLGKSKCVCNAGYEGDGYTCNAIVGCTSHQDCAVTEQCVPTSNQRYECVCKDDYVRDSQHVCVPAASSCGGGTCVENAVCLYDDEYQTFYCQCKAGYVGDGITECRIKPIGCDTLNNCGLHATCQYEKQALTYVCRCKPGFFGDGFNCYGERNCHTDPQMCDLHAACLTDANRRYVCECNSGYVGNGTICREISQHEGNFLLVNQGMATLKIPMEQSKNNLGKPIQTKLYQTAVGLDVDCLEGRVYWSDLSSRVIRSSLFNGSGKADFIKDKIGAPEGLAVDWVSRNIYWTDSTFDTIEVANLDSKRRKTLFNTNLVNPRGIAVHPQRGKIFWTDWNRKDPKIEWANADGTRRETFLRGENASLPNSLTVDYESDQLCYTDAGTKKIECIHIDTRTRQTIAVNCTYPFGIAVSEKHIYWTDWISKKIERVDKYSLARLSPLTLPLGGSGKLFGLAAVSKNCPQLTNICQGYRNQCPDDHICVPNGLGGRSCLCAYRSDAPDEPISCNP